jgi:hypothetical protein
VPWEKHPETKTSSDRLLDLTTGDGVTIFGQGVIKARKAYVNGVTDLTPVFKPYLMLLVDTIVTAVRWRWDWEEKNPDAAIEVPVDQRNTMMKDEDGNLLFDTVIHYKSLVLMVENLIYLCCLQWIMW